MDVFELITKLCEIMVYSICGLAIATVVVAVIGIVYLIVCRKKGGTEK